MRTEERGSGALRVVVLSSDDGLIAPLDVRDVVHNVTCQLADLTYGIEVPCNAIESARTNQMFLDEACSQPVVVAGDGTCPPPPLAELPTFSCPQYFEVVDELIHGPVYDGAFDGCALNPQVHASYPLGRRVEPLRLQRAPGPSGHRMRDIVLSNGETWFREPFTLYDVELGAECRVGGLVKDGDVVPCHLPRAFNYEYAPFADAACTQPLPAIAFGGPGGGGGCGLYGEVPRLIEQFIGAEAHVLRIGARRSEPAYTMFGASCDPITWPTYDIVEDLGPGRIATARKKRDP
ncbi:MAG TPA: hypothetical protein VK427_01890 [Kofleriaceae bacterium]|nr:hypothetical protein [Kofleriaceae bacterium]